MPFFRLTFLVSSLAVAAPAAHAAQYFYDKDGVKVFAGGFAEFDVISDTTRSLGEVIGSAPDDKKSDDAQKRFNANGDSGRLQFSDRNSRFAFGVQTARPGHVKSKGYVEFDLLGYDPAANAWDTTKPPTNSEAGFYQNPTMRLRHAYLLAEGEGWSVMSGQYWTLFGWQADYVMSTVQVAPVTGEVYQRTPQLTFIKTFGDAKETNFQAGLSLARPTMRDADQPNVEAGLRMVMGGHKGTYTAASGDLKQTPMSIGVSATSRDFVEPMYDTENTNNSGKASPTALAHHRGNAVAVDLMAPIIGGGEKEHGNNLTLTGEYTSGEGYGDMFPSWSGNIGQPVGAVGSVLNIDPGLAGNETADAKHELKLLKLSTWNTSLQYHLPGDGTTWATTGAAELCSDNAAKMWAAGGKQIYTCKRNRFINFMHDFSQEMRAGLEYDWDQTRYADNTHSQNNRVQMSTWYRF